MGILRSACGGALLLATTLVSDSGRACSLPEFDDDYWTFVRPDPDFSVLTAAQIEQWRGRYYDWNGALGLSFSLGDSDELQLVVAVVEEWRLLESGFDSDGDLVLEFEADWRPEIVKVRLRVDEHGVCSIAEDGNYSFFAERMRPGRAAQLRVQAAVWGTIHGVAEMIGGTADAAMNWAIDFTNRIGWK